MVVRGTIEILRITGPIPRVKLTRLAHILKCIGYDKFAQVKFQMTRLGPLSTHFSCDLQAACSTRLLHETPLYWSYLYNLTNKAQQWHTEALPDEFCEVLQELHELEDHELTFLSTLLFGGDPIKVVCNILEDCCNDMNRHMLSRIPEMHELQELQQFKERSNKLQLTRKQLIHYFLDQYS